MFVLGNFLSGLGINVFGERTHKIIEAFAYDRSEN